MNLPLCGVAAFIIVLVRIPDITAKESFTLSLVRKVLPKLDLTGFSLFAPASVMVLLALQFGGGEQYPWSSPTVIGLFCGGGVIAIIFILWEAKVGEGAMIPGKMLRNRIVLASSGQSMCLIVAVLGGSSWLPMYFQAVKGEGPTMSGVDLLPGILSQLLLAVLSGVGGKSTGAVVLFRLLS
jgi:hypothetical protein